MLFSLVTETGPSPPFKGGDRQKEEVGGQSSPEHLGREGSTQNKGPMGVAANSFLISSCKHTVSK